MVAFPSSELLGYFQASAARTTMSSAVRVPSSELLGYYQSSAARTSLKAMSAIGKSVPRKEGRKKVTGQALYIDDLTFPDMLHGATVRSPVARGRIKNISFEGDIPWDEFVIVTSKDIPGANYVALILNDQPYL